MAKPIITLNGLKIVIMLGMLVIIKNIMHSLKHYETAKNTK